MQRQSTGLDPTKPDPGVVFTVAPHAFLALAALLAFLLHRRHVRPAPGFTSGSRRWQGAAVFLGGMALASWVGWGLVALLPEWSPTRPAFVGLLRVIFHASQACRVALPLLLWGFARWELGFVVQRDARELVEQLAARFVGALAICVLGYPSIMRGDPTAAIDPLRLLYAAIDVVAVIESARLVIRWTRVRGAFNWLRWTWAPIWVLALLILGDAILLVVGPYRLGFWGASFRVEQAGLIALWGLVCGVIGTCLLRRPEP